MAEWFLNETDEILLNSARRPFEASIDAIERLERRAASSLDSAVLQDALRSCADLRLEVAINSDQSFDICEELYRKLLALDPEPIRALIKTVMIARNLSAADKRSLALVSAALLRANASEVPQPLMAAAQKVLSDASDG